MRLYLHNPYMKRFSAKVLGSIPWKGKTALILDQTAFYPSGGGQPHDMGYLGDYPVLEVEEVDDVILHGISGDYKGEKELTGVIDWGRRFDHMQQHAAQHLLSDYLREAYGMNTLSFHLGKEITTVDLEPPIAIPIPQVEEALYEVVLENRLIETHFLPREEVVPEVLEKTGSADPYIRFVEMKGFPPQACRGTHPERSGEIGLIKIIKVEREKSALRLSFVAGFRTLWRMQADWENLTFAKHLFKVNESGWSERLVQMKEELENNRKQIRRLSQEKIEWEKRFRIGQAPQINGICLHIEIFEDRPFQELKELAKSIIETSAQLVLFATLAPKTQVVAACSQELSFSMPAFLQRILPHGKGGGSRVFAQFGGEKEELLAHWGGAVSFMRNELWAKGQDKS